MRIAIVDKQGKVQTADQILINIIAIVETKNTDISHVLKEVDTIEDQINEFGECQDVVVTVVADKSKKRGG